MCKPLLSHLRNNVPSLRQNNAQHEQHQQRCCADPAVVDIRRNFIKPALPFLHWSTCQLLLRRVRVMQEQHAKRFFDVPTYSFKRCLLCEKLRSCSIAGFSCKIVHVSQTVEKGRLNLLRTTFCLSRRSNSDIIWEVLDENAALLYLLNAITYESQVLCTLNIC